MLTHQIFNRLIDELGEQGHQQANSYRVKRCSSHEISIENTGSVTTATLKSVVKKEHFSHDHEILIRTRGSVSRIRMGQNRLMIYASGAPLSVMTRRSNRLELVSRIPAFCGDRSEAGFGLAKAAFLGQGVWLDMVESDCGIRRYRNEGGTEVTASSHQEIVFQELEQAMIKASFREVKKDGLYIEALPLKRSLARWVCARFLVFPFPIRGIGLPAIRCEVAIPLSRKRRRDLTERVRQRNEKESLRRSNSMQVAGWVVRREEISFGTCVPAPAASSEALLLVLHTLMERIELVEWLVNLSPFTDEG